MKKQYARLPAVPLPIDLNEAKDQLKRLLVSRSSYRNFSGKPVNLQQISTLLYYSAGVVRTNRRPYPFAGEFPSLEIYLWVRKGSDMKPGLYHYDPFTHSLEVLLSSVTKADAREIWMRQRWVRKAAVIGFITASYLPITSKYGPWGAPFPLIEAGHLVQNVYLLCPTLGLGCRAVGRFREAEVIRLLDLDPKEEYPIYYFGLESL